ncbi:MAG: hypothetical protein U9Q80_12430 [Bacillota bacterium]|nr:hypothetical protein [Bacillota bacterium]
MKNNIPKLIENINKSNIETWKLKIRTEYEVGIDEYFIVQDPSEKSYTVRVSLLYCDENMEPLDTVGYVDYRVFNTFDRVTGEMYFFLDMIDSVDQDTYDIFYYFLGEDGYLHKKYCINTFYHIEKIEIYEKYQNIGLGTLMMEYLLSEHSDIGVLFVVKPFAFLKEESEELEEYNVKLKSFYTHLGFKKLIKDVWYHGDYK